MRKTLIAGLAARRLARRRLHRLRRPTWAPAASATVHPGVMTYTDGAQCTANFVYTDAAGTVYIGQAAHCSGTGGQTDTDGCHDAEPAERHARRGHGRLASPARWSTTPGPRCRPAGETDAGHLRLQRHRR